MYQYNLDDKTVVKQRAEQFREQTERFLAGTLSDEEFMQQRLRNGLYVQKHAPMLRIAIPYGTLNSTQLKRLAHITRRYDKGYGHFTTRQNLQINWPQIKDVPDILDELAAVEMHAIQTSGNCIRNITSDHLAGITHDEVVDPRPYCEILRQWSTLHPEFYYLPRKFKFAVSASLSDRAIIKSHDIGLLIVKNDTGETGLKVFVGGGLGRTPILGQVIYDFLPIKYMLSYVEAILRIYNQFGRRDNIYKARIKILVKSLGIEEFKRLVDTEWKQIRQQDDLEVLDEKIAVFVKFFQMHYPLSPHLAPQQLNTDAEFRRWYEHNTLEHKEVGYRVVFVSLKHPDNIPGDMTDVQMDAIANLAEQYSFGMLRTTADQNLVLETAIGCIYALWQQLDKHKLAYPNIDTASNIICCPGLDLCSLANAYTIGISQQLTKELSDFNWLYKIGKVSIKMSGCMNACAHHHIANIGILGVEKEGDSYYQINLGGNYDGQHTTLGKIIGKAIPAVQITAKIRALLEFYVAQRLDDENFITTLDRVGLQSFKDVVYPAE